MAKSKNGNTPENLPDGFLVGQSSLIRGRKIALTPEKQRLVIGADSDCDVTISGSTMAPRHAVLEYVDGDWNLIALDDDGLVWVNEEPIKVAVLESGDRVEIGRHRWEFLENTVKDSKFSLRRLMTS